MVTKTKVIRNVSVNICFHIGVQGHIIGSLSFLIFKAYDIFIKAVHNFIRFACDYLF